MLMQIPENETDPLEVDLGDGTFADLMGCDTVAVEQLDVLTQQLQTVVLSRANLEQLLSRLL